VRLQRLYRASKFIILSAAVSASCFGTKKKILPVVVVSDAFTASADAIAADTVSL
tara:strand:- start:145 stop:309 length:165 start_codon:yes stop_codon:yes gene_type:complete